MQNRRLGLYVGQKRRSVHALNEFLGEAGATSPVHQYGIITRHRGPLRGFQNPSAAQGTRPCFTVLLSNQISPDAPPHAHPSDENPARYTDTSAAHDLTPSNAAWWRAGRERACG